MNTQHDQHINSFLCLADEKIVKDWAINHNNLWGMNNLKG